MWENSIYFKLPGKLAKVWNCEMIELNRLRSKFSHLKISERIFWGTSHSIIQSISPTPHGDLGGCKHVLTYMTSYHFVFFLGSISVRYERIHWFVFPRKAFKNIYIKFLMCSGNLIRVQFFNICRTITNQYNIKASSFFLRNVFSTFSEPCWALL